MMSRRTAASLSGNLCGVNEYSNSQSFADGSLTFTAGYRQLHLLLPLVKAHDLVVPLKVPGDSFRQSDTGFDPGPFRGVFGFDHPLWTRHRGGDMFQRPQMGGDSDSRETRRAWPNPRHYREQVVIRMRAPGMRIRTRGLWLLGPCGQAQRHHLPPRPQQSQILIAHSGVTERACEVKAEIICGFSHLRERTGCRESGVTGG